jgi:hypothetical protein
MVGEQPHEAFDFGVGKGIEVGLADLLEVNTIVPLPGVFLNEHKLNWPDRFRAVLQTTYRKNHIQARVKAKGIISKEDFLVNSGTRQGCPLSLLIYAVVADLYNMAVINHRSFKRHKTLPENFVKILAYADDIAVHLGLLANVKIYHLLLRQYSLATGGVTNFNKSEGILCGRWRHLAPNLGINIAKSSKYLGVITGLTCTWPKGP